MRDIRFFKQKDRTSKTLNIIPYIAWLSETLKALVEIQGAVFKRKLSVGQYLENRFTKNVFIRVYSNGTLII